MTPRSTADATSSRGGTWLAVATRGRVAAITNFRIGTGRRDAAHSRGALTREYLTGGDDAENYLQRVSQRANEYNGFSLIVGVPDQLYFFSNRGAGVQRIATGVHGLSNHLLDEPWPKVRRGTTVLTDLLAATEEVLVASLFEVLADRTPAPDALLPATGVTLQRERDLSPAFIAGETCGTRASTVVLVGRDGRVLFREQSYGPRGQYLGDSEQRFELDRAATAPTNPAAARA